MGLSEAEIEELTEFVRRYCAVENTEEPQEGRFTFHQGKSQRVAVKAVRAPVPWGEVERTTSEVIRRVRELQGNGEGHVFVRAYLKTENNHESCIRIQGQTDALAEDEDDDPPHGDAIGRLVTGLLRSQTMVMRENQELRERAHRMIDVRIEETEQRTMLAMHSQMLELAGEDRRMADALAALGPTIEAVTPKVMEALLRMAQGSGPTAVEALPEEPGARFDALVGRMVEAAQALGGVAASQPVDWARARAANLYILVRQIAPFLGLTVTGYPEAPAAEASP